MAIEVLSGPAAEPLSLAEAKLHLRVDGNDEDTLISACITAAKAWVEKTTQRIMVNQTIRETRDAWPTDWPLYLHAGPISAINSVKVITAGTLTTLDPATYQFDGRSKPCRFAPLPGVTLPAADTGRMAAVQLEYVAGHGAAAANVPEIFKQAIRILIAHWYEHRESVQVGVVSGEMENGLSMLLLEERTRAFDFKSF